MRGRKAKPATLKLLSGEKRPSRLKPEQPAARPGAATAPEWLSEAAAAHFDRLSAVLLGMAVASPDDRDALALLASRLEEVEILTATIEDQGRTYRHDSGLWKARPEVAMRNEAMRHAQALLVEFGLTPSARSKVSAGKPAEANPFAALDRAG